MFTRILVPLDGSAQAERALADAARLARASEGTIILVRVIRPLIEYDGGRAAAGVWLPAADTALRDAAAAYLTALRQKEPLRGVATEAHVLVGPAAQMILHTAERQRVDSIVMSSHARRGLSRLVLGSIAGAIVREAQVPVLVRRDTTAPSVPGFVAGEDAGQPVSALVALDGSPLAEGALVAAVRLVGSLAHPSGGAIHLLRVVEPSPKQNATQSLATRRASAERRRAIRRELRDAREYLEAAADQVRELAADARNVTVTWSVERGQDVAGVILRAAEATTDATGSSVPQRADVIAMGTHGRGGLKRWFIGSVAESVLRNANVPVLTVRPRDRAVTLKPGFGELIAAAQR
ncbi:MAG: universal stress protein [Ktedonobacterales bacterium]